MEFERINCKLQQNSQDKLLEKMYKSDIGKQLLKVLTGKAVSELGGRFMDSPLSVPVIKPFIEKNNIDIEIDYKQDIIVVLDDIQDPGNLGTILRTVDSIGLTQILVSKGTADCYNPKVVRSTMGAIFRIKIIECEDLTKTLKEIRKHKFKLVVTSLQTDKSLYDINLDRKSVV